MHADRPLQAGVDRAMRASKPVHSRPCDAYPFRTRQRNASPAVENQSFLELSICMETTTTKRGFLLTEGWIQAVLRVTLFGFLVLGILAYNTYTGEPPIPAKVLDPDGRLLFTRADIMAGQATFLRNGLMEYGSIFGHGAYLGPDYTADYLHRSAQMAIDF